MLNNFIAKNIYAALAFALILFPGCMGTARDTIGQMSQRLEISPFNYPAIQDIPPYNELPLLVRLGTPYMQRGEESLRQLQYRSESCVLDIFIEHSPTEELQNVEILYMETRPRHIARQRAYRHAAEIAPATPISTPPDSTCLAALTASEQPAQIAQVISP